MDASELLGEVKRRIDDAMRDRDRLTEAVGLLDGEIARLQSDAEVVARLTSWFAPQRAADEASPEAAAEIQGTAVAWPSGPGFESPLKTKKLRARSRAKFAAAGWYVGTLRKLSWSDEPLSHTLGVEMAVDGVVQSLCAAFESELCALTKAIERVAEIPEDRRTPLHLVTWSKLAAATTVFDIDLASALSISDALVGEHSEEPHGWLAQLLLLRKRLALQDFLVDEDDEGQHTSRLRINVPGRGALPLVEYLSEVHDLTEELLETIEHDIADAKHGRLYIAAIDEVRARAEQGIGDLLSSAFLPEVENLK
jgi:hypothetical protein